ncbi:MAG: hypothetical protein GF334_05840 [Candidatus Altiarchaeales archaeon]|nr:hypothetical protein [Candidatus Altiarchaeales archaeon]
MRVVGLDLAGKETNESGVCLLEEVDGVKSVTCSIQYSDQQIHDFIFDVNPDLVAVDAPLTFGGETRECDRLLANYGALPPTLPGMRSLADRGKKISESLSEKNIKSIEVNARACIKILGVGENKEYGMQKKIMGLDLSGDVNTRLLTRDELDAVCCAITGYLHLAGKTRAMGDEDCLIILPQI